jgi:PKD repeat protein
MKTRLSFLSAFLLLAVGSAHAALRYVDANSANPCPPYTNSATAARVIQDAVNAALPGDEIIVADGLYATGGRVVGTNLLVNRVAVDKPLILRSVNGPQVTVIEGYQVPGTTNGDGAVRCVYLAHGASLSGFTLTNGATRTDDWTRKTESSGGGVRCESEAAVISNCVLTGNSAYLYGGGSYSGTLINCALTGNSAAYGGGACDCQLNNCTVTLNSATRVGGICDTWESSTRATANNCVIYFNSALFEANYALDYSRLNYCCTTPLPAEGVGNITADPQLASASHLSAGSPCRGAGSAVYASGTDIDGELWENPPSIGCDEFHAGAVTGPLSASISASFTNVAIGFAVELTAMIEGRASVSKWDFGDGVVVSNRPCATHAWAAAGDYTVFLCAYNGSHPEGVTTSLLIHVAEAIHYVMADGKNPQPPYSSWTTAATNIQDAVDAATVTGAIVLVTNGTYASGGRAAGTNMSVNRVAVDKPITLRSVNGPQFTVIRGYQVPGTTNGNGAIRGVYLANGASLAGFTLTNGATRTNGDYEIDQSGAGVWCEPWCSWSAFTSALVSNCVITGNSAASAGGGVFGGTLNNCVLAGNSAGAGGGAHSGTLNNCVLTGNSANTGGGAFGSTLNNCTITGNSTDGIGGGDYESWLNNCIEYFNTGPDGANNHYGTDYCPGPYYSCTTPMPTEPSIFGSDFGNITNAPLFVDYAGGNLRLQSNSPCINAGSNAYGLIGYVPGPADLDGKPRIVSGTVDIGAYEFQGPGSVISYAWLQQFGLPTDGSADATDADRDGMSNWQEWRCRTDPTNALSVLRLLSASSDGTNLTVNWQSIAGVSYLLERSTDLSASPPFLPLASGLEGRPGATSFTDTNAASLAPRFYRVAVP